MQRSIDKTPAEHFHQICCRWMKKTCTTKIIYSYALVMSLKTFFEKCYFYVTYSNQNCRHRQWLQQWICIINYEFVFVLQKWAGVVSNWRRHRRAGQALVRQCKIIYHPFHLIIWARLINDGKIHHQLRSTL